MPLLYIVVSIVDISNMSVTSTSIRSRASPVDQVLPHLLYLFDQGHASRQANPRAYPNPNYKPLRQLYKCITTYGWHLRHWDPYTLL